MGAGLAVDQTQGSGTVDNVMPLVDAQAPVNALALLLVTSVFAPLAEEYVFRGFLLTSLTKWMPTPGAGAAGSGRRSLTSPPFKTDPGGSCCR